MTSMLKMFGRPQFGKMVAMLFLIAGIFPQKAIGDGGGKSVKCHVCASYNNPSCLDLKNLEDVETKMCSTGYCYQEVTETSANFKQIWRRCATEGDLQCLKNKPGMTCFSERDHLGSCQPRGRLGEGEKKFEQKAAYCLCDSDLCNSLTTTDVTFTIPPTRPTPPTTPAPPPSDVQCYSCEDTQGSDCHKFPETMKKINCPSGYCYEAVHERANGGAPVKRGCAEEDGGYIKCLKDEPDMCAILIDVLNDDVGKMPLESLKKCIEKGGELGRRYREKKEVFESYNTATCLCKTNLCNTRTSGASWGRSDPGFIYAVVAGAILMTSRATFLVGSG